MSRRPPRRPSDWPEPLSGSHIVACVDGSVGSEMVVPVALGWADALHMRLSVVTIAEDSPVDSSGLRSNRFGPQNPEEYVLALAERWRTAAPDITGEVVYDPIGVASGMRSYLNGHPASLVALTIKPRDGFERLRLGTTAANIIQSSNDPTLVIPLADRS